MSLSILLVDDDPFMHRMLVPRLKELDLPISHVVSAQSPDVALALLSGIASPMAVISDFNLKASMTGLDLLREVRARRPESVRVLFSGYSLEQLGGGDEAVDAFIEKTLHLDEFVRPLRDVLAARMGS